MTATTNATSTSTTSSSKKKVLAFAAAIAVAAGVALYASPYWALHSLSTAVRDKDAARVSEYVDFVLLRDSVKELLAARMDAEMKTRGVPADNVFGNLAQTFVKSLLTQAVDAMVSPSGVVRLLQGSSPAGALPGAAPAPAAGAGPERASGGGSSSNNKPRFHVDYRNYSTVHVSSEGREVGFIFHRHGLLSWKMVGIDGTLLDKPGAD